MSKLLTLEQRYEIQALINAKHRKIFIAKQFSVDKSTITREIQRNSGKRSYNAQKAQEMYNKRKKDVFRKIRFTESMKKFVSEKKLLVAGANDNFVIRNAESYNITLQIYNRWGRMIYENTNYQNDFSCKTCAAGVYYYVIKAKSKRNGREKEYKGSLMIFNGK